jgi:hypothetical protein
MSDLLHDLESCLQDRIAYGAAARLAADVGGEPAAILAEFAHRLGPTAAAEVITLAVDITCPTLELSHDWREIAAIETFHRIGKAALADRRRVRRVASCWLRGW